MSRAVAFACTLAVGGLIALQPPANAALARHVGDLGAALISAVITVTVLAVLLLVFSEPARLSGLAGFKPQYAIGGIGGAAVVAVSLVAVRPLGVAGVISLLVAGQLGDLGAGRPAGMVRRCTRRIDAGASGRCVACRGGHAADHATLTRAHP